jgi:hypothetical protein
MWLLWNQNLAHKPPVESQMVMFEVKQNQSLPAELGTKPVEASPNTTSQMALPKSYLVDQVKDRVPRKPTSTEGGNEVADTTPTKTSVSDLETGSAGSGGARPFLSFLPRPDLNRAGKTSLPIEKTRNPLELPSPAPPLKPMEMPKTLYGGAGVFAKVAEDGSIRFTGPKDIQMKRKGVIAIKDLPKQDLPEATPKVSVRVGAEWSYDLTDILMRAKGKDPYSAIKRKLADETRDARLCMAQKAREKRHKEALYELATKVQSIINQKDLALAAQRQLVFELWDECDEAPDESLANYVAMARATISGIIQKSFPAGSERAYPPAELAELNRRRTSQRIFAPYEQSAATLLATPPSTHGLCP